jgi:APA family basic amino acid/polyamine antiporter
MAVGLGAIVGGGILTLGGVAFAAAGPGAIAAFALNGAIAFLTAVSFSEMSARFPESGGTYTFAKKVLSMQSAFTLGWVVWFASIVAGALYALGFAVYAAIALNILWQALFGSSPAWLAGRPAVTVLAAGATLFYVTSLSLGRRGGGQWETVGKIVVFAVLILGGMWALAGKPLGQLRESLTPFFHGGAAGVFRAMGYTFIALQGFDLIAAVAGEVRDPGRNIPRAMFLSLAVSLAIYIPFLFIIAAVGAAPGQSIASISAERPETVIALAVKNYLGPAGFWLVIFAAILSMLSALHANLLAASRVAFSMARDRTLPRRLGRSAGKRGAPVPAIAASALTLLAILVAVPGIAAAGSAASLIFLASFTTVHYTSILAGLRSGPGSPSFKSPLFPMVPVVGGLACAALAVFQAFAVPAAGIIAGIWVVIGVIVYLALFARRARVLDASVQAYHPDLVVMRGRSPFVLVPLANPANAQAMVTVAHALAPPGVGRVLLLSVVTPPASWEGGPPPRRLVDAQAVLGEVLSLSFAAGYSPEALITVAPEPRSEIRRVARFYRCESLLLGLSDLNEEVAGSRLDEIMSGVDGDIVILRAAPAWNFSGARRVLVPVGGMSRHDELRGRLLGSLERTGPRDVTYLRIVPESAAEAVLRRTEREIAVLADDEMPGKPGVEVVRGVDVAAEVGRRADESDLVILGLQRPDRHRRVIGDMALSIARRTSCAMIMISRGG